MASKKNRSETYRSKQGNNFFMPSHAGHQQSRSIFGRMHSELQTTYATQYQTRKMVAHLWNDSAEQTYHQNFGTIIPSDVQSTHWIITYKAANSRIQKVEPESTIGHKPRIIPKTRKLVTLVLSLETGLVSPQYHVQYDNFFETV
jgi:uncharacterized protein affecting Mg2+/Co2+ transport